MSRRIGFRQGALGRRSQQLLPAIEPEALNGVMMECVNVARRVVAFLLDEFRTVSGKGKTHF